MFSGQFPRPTDGDKPSTWSGKKTGFETSSGLALERGKHLIEGDLMRFPCLKSSGIGRSC
jgi:hypothetical protein